MGVIRHATHSGPDYIKTALINGPYRYMLGRSWGTGYPTACFIMLNPSTADADVDDPTIRKCMGFARRWGMEAITVVNLFAFRTPDPCELFAESLNRDVIGPENQQWVVTACAGARKIVCAWGNHGGFMQRGQWMKEQLLKSGAFDLWMLGATSNGQPRHPCRISYDTPLEPFK